MHNLKNNHQINKNNNRQDARDSLIYNSMKNILKSLSNKLSKESP
jgi:hypothetical protein